MKLPIFGKDNTLDGLLHVNEDKLYPYYITQVVPADLIEDSKGKHPKIVTGTKGDGEDYTDFPFFLDESLKTKSNYNRPSEREVLQLIQTIAIENKSIRRRMKLKMRSCPNS